jgi:hypothetical protein
MQTTLDQGTPVIRGEGESRRNPLVSRHRLAPMVLLADRLVAHRAWVGRTGDARPRPG